MAFNPNYHNDFAPVYHGPRMRPLPFIPENPNAASAEYRQAGQFARGLSAAGNDLILEATAQQNRINETAVTDAVNKAKLEIMQKEADILSMTGPEAQQIPGMLQELYSSTYSKHGAGLGNSRMQEMFALRTQNAVQGALERGERARLNQLNKWNHDVMALEAETDVQELVLAMRPDGGGGASGWGVTTDAPVVTTQPAGSLSVSRASPGTVIPAGVPASVKTVAYEQVPDHQANLVNENGEVIPPIMPAAVIQRVLDRSDNRIAEMNAGKDSRVIADRQKDGRAAIHAMIIQTLSNYDPRQAYEYMKQESVQADMPPGMVMEQRKNLSDLAEMVDAREDAERAFTEAKKAPDSKMALEDARLRAYNDPRYQANPKAQKQYLAVLEANIDHDAAQEKLLRTQSIVSLSKKMLAADFDFNNLPPEEQRLLLLDGDEKDTPYRVFSRIKEFRKTAEIEGLGPDYAFYYEMKKLGAAAAWMAKDGLRPGDRAEELAKRLGGDKAMIKEIIALAAEGAANTGTSGGTASGSAKVSADFNWGTSFDGMWSKEALEVGDERDFRKNGWIAMGNQLVADAEENILKRKATFREKEDIAQQLYRDIEAGRIDVTLPYFKQAEQYQALRGTDGKASGRIEVSIASIPEFSERIHNHGEKVENLSPAVGSPRQNFGVIRPDDTRQLPPAIIDAQADEVLRAYQAGRIADQEYAAGDFIVYDRSGMIRIFGSDGEQKGGRIRDRAAMEEKEFSAIRARTEVEQKINQLENERAELLKRISMGSSARFQNLDAIRDRQEVKKIEEEIQGLKEQMQ